MRAKEFVNPQQVKEETESLNMSPYKEATRNAETPKKKKAKAKVEILQRK